MQVIHINVRPDTSKKTVRQKEIVSLLADHPALRVSELAEMLRVTTETIRRDLDELTERGLISRTYGGAILRLVAEPAAAQRHNLLIEERTRIANTAFFECRDARVFMLGSGATTLHVARRMASGMQNITVITHAHAIASALATNSTIKVLMTPGFYHSGEGAVYGTQTLRFLEMYSAEWAILGASGIAPDGPSDAMIEMADVYSGMIGRANRSMVVADASKFNQMFTARYAAWSQIDQLVTDQSPKSALRKAMQTADVEIKIAQSD
ncbi:DeoR/GlpR family DNA-binding transcription regulator [Hyphomicrobium methylovorum]|uniref:DeoR/GlpR family DNA-binding transcription regulator n=1 Tax=Hyphomicrobium methylovorum TaxID=84 RepID=UPI0031B64BAA